MNKDFRYFTNYIHDLIRAAESRRYAVHTEFLSEEEQAEAELVLKKEKSVSHEFFGGYPSAERRILYISDKDMSVSDTDITALDINIKHIGELKLTHRDVLGSLTSLSVRRSVIGDIIFRDPDHAVVFVISNIADYFIENLTEIGGCRCSVSLIADTADMVFERRFSEFECIISSERIDCYIAALTKCSRSDSIALLKDGKIFINGCQTVSPTVKVRSNDKITVRGFGKFIVESEDTNLTRKGRLRVRIKKYI